MVQIAENIIKHALFVGFIPSTSYHWFKSSANEHSCLLSSTAGSNFIDFEPKETLKRVRNQAINQIQAITDNLLTWSLISLRSFITIALPLRMESGRFASLI